MNDRFQFSSPLPTAITITLSVVEKRILRRTVILYSVNYSYKSQLITYLQLPSIHGNKRIQVFVEYGNGDFYLLMIDQDRMGLQQKANTTANKCICNSRA